MIARLVALNTIVAAIARFLNTALALVTIGLITRYLSKTAWGEYALILTFGGIFSVLADGGLYQLLVREISRPGANEQKIVNNLFILRLLSGFFIFGLAPLVALLFPYSNQAFWGIVLGMLGFWFLSNTQVLMGLFQKYLRLDKVAIAETFGRIVQLILVWFFIKKQLNFFWIVSALTLGGLANFIWIALEAGRWIKWQWQIDINFWWQSIKQALPLGLAAIFTMIYFSFDTLILSLWQPAAVVGAYRLSYKVLESLIFFPAMFSGLIMPFLSQSAGFDNQRFCQILQNGQKVLLIFAVPLVLGTFILSPQVIDLLGGGNYPEAAAILNILIVATGIIFLSTLYSYALIALGKQKVILKISLVAAIFSLAFNLIFVPFWSYWATAISHVLVEFFVMMAMFLFLAKDFKFYTSFLNFGLKCLAAALPMMMILWWCRGQNIFLLMILAVVFYFGLLYLFKVFSFREIFLLIKKTSI